MALKFKFKSKDEIPVEQQALYVERDGGWVLDVDGAADKAKLDEFRANNIALTNQLAEQKKRFEGIDPEQVRKLAEEKQRLEEEQQLKAGEVEKVLENRIRGLKAEWEKQVAGLTERQWLARARQGPMRPPMPGLSLQAMAPQDLKAIYRYIRWLGPRGEPAPPPLPPGVAPQGPVVVFPAP